MTLSASLNVQASKKSYTSKVTRILHTKRKPDARISCTSNNLVQKGSTEKHNHTELINSAKQLLKYSQFPNREGAQYLVETVIRTSQAGDVFLNYIQQESLYQGCEFRNPVPCGNVLILLTPPLCASKETQLITHRAEGRL